MRGLAGVLVGCILFLVALACTERVDPVGAEVSEIHSPSPDDLERILGDGIYKLVPLGDFGETHLGRGEAHAVNNRGVAVGWSETETSFRQAAFRWEDGEMERLPTWIEGKESAALDINERGDIVGWVEDVVGRQAVIWDGGEGRPFGIGTVGGEWAEAVAVNNRGQVVGNSETAQRTVRAFFWDDGGLRALEMPEGAEETFAVDINDRGQILGYSDDGRMLLWEGTRVRDLGQGRPLAMNNRGTIVGSYAGQAAVFQSGEWELIETPGGMGFIQATAINDRGHVLAYNLMSIVIWEDRNFTFLEVPPQYGPDGFSIGYDLSNSGLAAGSFAVESVDWTAGPAAIWTKRPLR